MLSKTNKSDLIIALQNSLQQVKGYSKPDVLLGLEYISIITKAPESIDKNFYTLKNADQINADLIPYLDKLHEIVMTENITNQELTISIEKLELEIYNNSKIDNSQLLIFFAGSNVAKYSDLYWEQNTTKWKQISPLPHESFRVVI